MHRTIAVITAVILTAAGAPASADTAAVTGGAVSVPDTVLADEECVEVPVDYDFTGMETGHSWTLELDSTSAYGIYAYGIGGDLGTVEALWCPDDLVGTFSLVGDLVVVDGDYNNVSTDIVALHFEVVKRRTSVTFRVTDTTPKAGKVIRLKGCISSADHRDAFRDATIQFRKSGGDWRRLLTTVTDEVGCFNEPAYSVRADKTYLRVRVPSSSSQTGAYSKIIKIKAHR